MRKIKRVSILSMLLALIMLLSACSTEAKLYQAYIKQQEIESLESESNFKFSIKAENSSEEITEIVEEIAKGLEEVELGFKQKAVGEMEPKIKSKAEVEFVGKYKEQEMLGTIWVDVEEKDDKNIKMIQIQKLPKEFMGILGDAAKGKDYIVYDFDELMEYQLKETGNEEAIKIDMTKIMDWAVDAQPKLIKFSETYFKNLKLEKDIVKNLGSKIIDNKELDVYQLSIDDATLKELIKQTGEIALEDESLKEIFGEYFKLVFEMMEAGGQVSEEEMLEIEKSFSEVQNQMPEVKNAFNKFMAKLENIQLLGKDGIKVELGINEEGYIVSEKGIIDLVVDLDSISKLEETNNKEVSILPELKGKIHLGIEYGTKIKNINNKNIKINFPTVNDKNSVSYVEILKEQAKQLEEMEKELQKELENMEINILVNGKKVDFKGQDPVLDNLSILVPVRDIFESLGFNVGWSRENKSIILKDKANTILLKVNSNKADVNGKEIEISEPVTNRKGNAVISLDDILTILDVEIDYQEEGYNIVY